MIPSHCNRDRQNHTMVTTVFEDLNLLVVEAPDEYGLKPKRIEELKSRVDVIISLNIEDVFHVVDHETIAKMDKRQLSQYTHIISDTIDFPQYEVITLELMMPVVSSDWLESVHRTKKVESLRSYSPNPKHFMKKLLIASDSVLPPDDKLVLKTSAKTFGGFYVDELKRTMTHYVTDSLETQDSKLVIAANNTTTHHIHIVKPSWIIDSIIAGKLLPEKEYSVDSKSRKKAFTIPDCLLQLKFSLSSQLKFSNSMNEALNVFGKCDGPQRIHICDYFDESIDHKTQKQRTFNFLFSTIFQDTHQPQKSLLFYPRKRNHVNGFQMTKISVTNYTGESRYYIEELIVRMGGTFTKFLKNSNTHLVSSKFCGKKCNFSTCCDCKVLNHMWIEDCYVSWNMIDDNAEIYHNLLRDAPNVRLIGDIRFNGFESSAEETPDSSNNCNLDEMERTVAKENHVDSEIKKSSLDVDASVDVIPEDPEKHSFTQVPETQGQNDKSLSRKGSASVSGKTVSITEDVESKERTTISLEKQTATVNSNFKNHEDREKIAAEPKAQKKSTMGPKFRKSSDLAEHEEDETNSVWKIPEDESATIIDRSKTSSKRTSPTTELENEKSFSNKKLKKLCKPYNIIAIATGLDYTLSATDKRELKKVGISIVENATKNTNTIIAPSLLRTQKFLTALSFDPIYFLCPIFLTDVLGTLDSVNRKLTEFESIKPNVENYDIWKSMDYKKDIISKKIFTESTTKEKAIELMKKQRRDLFKGWKFNLTPGLAGGFDTVSAILKSYGCSGCYPFKNTTKTPAINTRELINNIEHEIALLVCTSKETTILKHFEELCNSADIKYIAIEWDEVVHRIFEANVTIDTAMIVSSNVP